MHQALGEGWSSNCWGNESKFNNVASNKYDNFSNICTIKESESGGKWVVERIELVEKNRMSSKKVKSTKTMYYQ